MRAVENLRTGIAERVAVAFAYLDIDAWDARMVGARPDDRRFLGSTLSPVWSP